MVGYCVLPMIVKLKKPNAIGCFNVGKSFS